MAIFISSGLTLSPAVSLNYGIIGYKNYATTTNLSATSETSQNPATNMANPATAYRWEAGDSAYSSDAIIYSGTNLMPSPFDPSGWSGSSDADGTITNINTPNPSGEAFVGLIESVTGDRFSFADTTNQTVSGGGYVYLSVVFKPITDPSLGIRFRFFSNNIEIGDGYARPIGQASSTSIGDLSFNFTDLGAGFTLMQCRCPVAASTNDFDAYMQYYRVNDLGQSTGFALIGDQSYVQAAYFGKADDWPATVQTAGKIPKQVLTINTSGQDIDYIGIARHNLDQQGLTMTVKYDGVEVIPASGVSSKQAIIFLTQLAAPNTVTIEIDGATTAPSIAVLYVGLSIRLQRNIYVGHTPITYGRDRVAINGVSENGQYLGEIVVRETNSTSVNLQNLTPDWYRSTLDPFFALSPRVPCFWAWRPDGYPDEVSYCWVEGNPRPTNQRSNGMMEVSWNFKGVA